MPSNSAVTVIVFIPGSPVAEEMIGANVTFRCFNQECISGNTFSDGTGAIRLRSFLPEGCSNPTIEVEKDGFLPASMIAREELVELTMTKLQRMNYTVELYPYCEKVDANDPFIVKDCTGFKRRWLDEQVHSTFTKDMHATISVSMRDQTFDQFLTYPVDFEDSFATDEQQEIDFVWGDARYDIDILIMKGNTPIGGYHAENILITYDEVAGMNNVLFKAVEYRPRPVEDYQQAGMFMFLYERGQRNDIPYAQELRPVFNP